MCTEPTIASSILVLRSLLLSRTFPTTTSRTSIITRLVSHLHSGQIKDPAAKATVYWLVGQCVREDGEKLLKEGCAADVVRLGAKSFPQEVNEPLPFLSLSLSPQKLTLKACNEVQSIPAKLQLLTLSAKVLVTSHLSPLTPHLRTLSLLFTYLTTLARYDLAYEVRDRSRFLSGLIDSAQIGKGGNGVGGGGEAKVMLDEEEFKRGVSVEEYSVDSTDQSGSQKEGEKRTLKVEQVEQILFDGKSFDSAHGQFNPITSLLLAIRWLTIGSRLIDRSNYSEHQLGSFSLLLPTKRPFSTTSSTLSTIPPYSTSAPPSSIRNPTTPQPGSTPSAPMQGFGSDSIRSISSNDFRRSTRGGTSSGGGDRREKVVLVPTSDDIYRGASGSRNGGGKKKEVNLDAFYRDEESSSEEEETEESSEEEQEEGQEEDDSDEEEGSEEDEESGEEEESEREGSKRT